MRNDSKGQGLSRKGGLAAALCLFLILGGCGLEEVDVPDFDGPSEFAFSLRLTAQPDILVADGFSTSLIQAVARDENGRPVAGRAIFFGVSDAQGRFADIGFFQTSGGPGTGASVVTNSQGLAQIVYQAPPRTDATANNSVLISARPIGDDFNGQFYRTVRIELRTAEPRLFPPGPADNVPPVANFVIEVVPTGSCTAQYACRVRVNQVVGLQNTSVDEDGVIVRYEWFFGDGSKVEYAPDQAHVFRTTGTFTVTLRVTDNFGAQGVRTATITVVP
jgi:hypothetical protein